MSQPTRIASQLLVGSSSVSTLAFAGVDVQAGDLLIVKWTSYFNRYATSITDTGVNTWTDALDWSAQTAFQAYAQLWYAIAKADQAGNVITLNGLNGINTYGTWLEVYRPSSGGAFTFVGASKQWISDTTHGPHELSSAGITIAGNVLLSMLVANGRDSTTATNVAISPGTIISRAEDSGSAGFSAEYFGADLSSQVVTGGMGGDLDGGSNWCYIDFLIAPFTYTSGGGGGGAISGTANLAVSATATASASGALAGAAALVLAASGVLAGAGALAGNAGMAFAATGTAQASGALSGNASLAVGAGGTLAGNGKLAGSAPLVVSASGTVHGTGALAGSAPLVVASTGTLGASGKLAGNASLVITATAAPTGPSGALSGSASMAFATTGTLAGRGALAGNANLAFANMATLSGIGTLGAQANAAFASTGSLTGTGLLAGTAGITFTAQGTPSAVGALEGVGGLTFTATGTLTNGLPSYPADAWYYIQLPARCFYAPAPARSFYALSNPNMTTTFSAKDPGDVIVFTLDATAELAEGETLTAITETEVTMAWNTDPNPAAVVSNPQINGAPVTITKPNGQTVTVAAGQCVQAVGTGGLNACGYHIAITCTRSVSPQVLVLKGILPVSSQ